MTTIVKTPSWTAHSLVEEISISQMNIKLQLQIATHRLCAAFFLVRILRGDHFEWGWSGNCSSYPEEKERQEGAPSSSQQKNHIPQVLRWRGKAVFDKLKGDHGKKNRSPGRGSWWEKGQEEVPRVNMGCHLQTMFRNLTAPKSSGSSGKGWGCMGHGVKSILVAAVQGTAWKKAVVKAGRSFRGSRHRQQRSDGSSFILAPNALHSILPGTGSTLCT